MSSAVTYLPNATNLPAESVKGWLGGTICPSENWTLVFNDEFDGTTLDRTKWDTYSCTVCPDVGSGIYMDANEVESEGTLKLIARADNPVCGSTTRPYSFGMIRANWSYSFQYGLFVERAKMPSNPGFFPTFWSTGGQNGSGSEIDVFEYGTCSPGILAETLHRQYDFNGDVGQDQTKTQTNMNLSSNFHLYSAAWDPYRIVYYIDGIEVKTVWRMRDAYTQAVIGGCSDLPTLLYTDYNLFPQDPNDDQNLESECKIAGFLNNNKGPTVSQDQLEIDYIRLYQYTPQPGFRDLCAPNSNISGVNDICNLNSVTYQFVGAEDGNPVWTCSSNLTILSSTATTVTVHANSLNSAPAWVQANFTGLNKVCSTLMYVENIWIGPPLTPVVTSAPVSPLIIGNYTSCTISANDPNATYSWSAGSEVGLTPSGLSCSISGQHVGTTVVSVTPSNTCGTVQACTALIHVVTSTGGTIGVFTGKTMLDKAGTDSLNSPVIFPNPANNQVNILLNASEPFTITLNDILGKKITPLLQRSDQQVTLDVSNLPNGLYFLMIDNGAIFQQKFIVQHQ